MRTQNITFFSLYFIVLSLVLSSIGTIFFPQNIQEQEYNSLYGDPQFFDFSFDAGKKYPFSQIFERNNVKENIESEDIGEVGNKTEETVGENISFQNNSLSSEYILRVFPSVFYGEVDEEKIPNIELFLSFPSVKKFLNKLEILIFENPSDSRGRMKSGRIYMYDSGKLSTEEFLTVFIHEYGHYIDIKGFLPNRFRDTSQYFYESSWKESTILLPGQKVSDFVSGYAMTNQYEDFAESFLYFILHNEAFKKRADTSPILKQKYDFFERYIFSGEEFQGLSFARDENIKEYYWDITKIPIEKEKFLQYLKTSL